MQSVKTAIGLMSGTSMDGIDAALIRSDGKKQRAVLAHMCFDYPSHFRRQLKQALDLAQSIKARQERPGSLAILEMELTSYHVQAVQQMLQAEMMVAEEVDLIGFHGQTILHRPHEGLSVQLGLGQELACQTGIDVIYDLRANDLAHGGQGAPMVPIYHALLARTMADRLDFPCCFVNIGGIANLTYVPFPVSEDDVFTQIIAFDCGPGNCLIDQWMESRAGLSFDAGGQAGLRGRVDETIIKDIMKQAVFSTAKPQSFDWRDFQPLVCEHLSVEEGAATLAHLTAQGIIHSFRFLMHRPKSLIVSGGGGKNACLMAALSEQANKIGAKVIMAEEYGLQADFIEAEAWAYLAIRALKELPLSFPKTTGVHFPVTGGVFAAASQGRDFTAHQGKVKNKLK